MPLRLDNARALPTCPQQEQQKNNSFESRFKIDLAASPMPEIKQPERLPPRATSNRKGGRDHLGILGEIKSVHPGEIVGISRYGSSRHLQPRSNTVTSPRKGCSAKARSRASSGIKPLAKSTTFLPFVIRRVSPFFTRGCKGRKRAAQFAGAFADTLFFTLECSSGSDD
jgi:hypothetical protein